MGWVKGVIRRELEELLHENMKNGLLKQFRGDILELEYKNDEVMIQDLLDSMENRLKDLEAALDIKDEEVLQLQTDKANLEARITALEPELEIP